MTHMPILEYDTSACMQTPNHYCTCPEKIEAKTVEEDKSRMLANVQAGDPLNKSNYLLLLHFPYSSNQ